MVNYLQTCSRIPNDPLMSPVSRHILRLIIRSSHSKQSLLPINNWISSPVPDIPHSHPGIFFLDMSSFTIF